MKNPVAKFMSLFNQPKVEEDNRDNLLSRISELEMQVESLKPLAQPEKVWKAGDRVKGNDQCGFNRYMHGVVTYVEPNREKVWVLRDGAGSDCFFYSYELEDEDKK